MADTTLPGMGGITQVFAMKTDKCTLQLLRVPNGAYGLNAGDLTQSPERQFLLTFWTKGDLKQLRNAISRELADG